ATATSVHPVALILSLILFLIIRRPPSPTLFPYTTLFRSLRQMVQRNHCALQRQIADYRFFRELLPAFRQTANLRLELHFAPERRDRKSTRLNSSHRTISYAVFCLKKKNTTAR